MAANTRTPLRAHARRNRERIVASARELFALKGDRAHMGDIAKHAGVGKGTLYRHFPDKEALFIEVILVRCEQLCELASHAEDIADPFDSVEAALRTTLVAIEGDTALQVALIHARELHREGIEEPGAALSATSTRILKRAQTAGVVRSDVTSDDIPMILSGIISTMYFRPSPADWERHLQLILAGLRPDECHRCEGETHVRHRGVPRPA